MASTRHGSGPVAAPYAADGLAGRITAPPSKSLTQRALVAAALAGDGARVVAPLDAEDPRLLVEALCDAGFRLEWGAGEVIARDRRAVAGAELFLGNNGTALRFLLAQLAALPGEWRLDGTPRLRQRPVAPLVRALESLGARFELATGAVGDPRLPMVLLGHELAGGEVPLDAAASSQFVSALLLLGPRLPRGLTIRLAAPPPSRPYIELTIEVLRAFGARAEASRDGLELRVAGGRLGPARYAVEGDWSAAAFPLAAVAVAGGEAQVGGVRLDSLQGDAVVARLLAGAGCRITAASGGVDARGPATGPLSADLRDAPDLFPALAVVAAIMGGRLTGLAGLAIKESDRLAVMTARLRELGFAVEATADTFTAPGGRTGARAPDHPLDPAGDHRVAMALAVAGSAVAGVRVADAGCVAKSWPGFWDQWRALAAGSR